MTKIKKIKIRINGKLSTNKVAIELNKEIINKKQIRNLYLKNKDKIEIVHFIGGG